MPYDAMVELPAYIGKNGPEVISRDNIPLFQQGLMMQQLNSEKLVVEATIEGSYEKALKAFTLNKTVPSMKVAKEVLDDMIEPTRVTGPSLSKSNRVAGRIPRAMPRPRDCVDGALSFGNAFYQIWHLSAEMFVFTAKDDVSYRLPKRVVAKQFYRSVLCV